MLVTKHLNYLINCSQGISHPFIPFLLPFLVLCFYDFFNNLFFNYLLMQKKLDIYLKSPVWMTIINSWILVLGFPCKYMWQTITSLSTLMHLVLDPLIFIIIFIIQRFNYWNLITWVLRWKHIMGGPTLLLHCIFLGGPMFKLQPCQYYESFS